MDEDRFCNGLQDYPQSVIKAMAFPFQPGYHFWL